MKIELTEQERNLLASAGIVFLPDAELDDDAAFALLDEVYEQEVFYAQDESGSSAKKAKQWANLADKIQQQIPE